MPLISSLGLMSPTNFGLASSGAVVAPTTTMLMLSSEIFAYKINSSTGFGVKYTDPPYISGGYPIYEGAFSNDNTVVAMAMYNTPNVIAYPWSNTSGFGTRYANPSSLPQGNQGFDLKFTPNKSHLIVGSNSNSLGLCAYTWSNGFGTQTFASSLSGEVYALDIDPAGTAVSAANQNNSPRLTVYNWSNGFGAKFANPSPVPQSNLVDLKFNPSSGASLAYANYDTVFIHAFRWANGFGTKYSNPSSAPSGNGGVISIAFNPSGTYLAVYSDGSGFAVDVYNWSDSTGFGTKLTSPYLGTIAPSYRTNNVAFDSTGKIIACSARSTGYGLNVFKWSNGFGDKYTNPSSLASDAQPHIVFSPS